jgi:hypothetical protein
MHHETVITDEPSLVYGDLPDVRNTRLEEASHRLVLRLRAWDGGRPDVGLPVDIDDLCNDVDEAIQLAHAAVMPVPPLLEVTGNVEEKELAARYMELKMKGVLFHARGQSVCASASSTWPKCFESALPTSAPACICPSFTMKGA